MSGGAVFLPDADATEHAGRALGHALEAVAGAAIAGGSMAGGSIVGGSMGGAAVVIGLVGDLGAGKTSLARATLRALGVKGTVRSPTYTIAEPYDTRIGRVWHLDLYRIAHPDEIEYIAIRDLVSESAACLVEWPERGGLPAIDCLLALAPQGEGRRLRIDGRTARGRAIGSGALATMTGGKSTNCR